MDLSNKGKKWKFKNYIQEKNLDWCRTWITFSMDTATLRQHLSKLEEFSKGQNPLSIMLECSFSLTSLGMSKENSNLYNSCIDSKMFNIATLRRKE